MTTEIYDYIIVGAGSAGCVLAERLTACGRHTVLLLEAGGSDRRFWVRTPLGYAKTFQDPAVNWRYRAAADPGLNGREAYWPRGRVLGGSSSINAMAYLRGLPQDFDGWEAAGATGWNWAAVRRTYAAIEAPEAGDAPICSVRLSELGPRRHPFTRHFLEGARQMGWPVADARAAAQDADPEGLAALRSTLRRGRRWSAADAFLRPALRRRNLRVITHAQAERVVMSQGRAEGVMHRHQGRTRFAAAAREVILSGGAVNSPQLLHLSGIGPAEALRRLGIAVVLDLPQVGRGLQDHLAISHAFQANEATLNNALGSWVGKGLAGARYLLSRGGPLALPINQISGFVRSAPQAATPDLQIYCNPISYRTDAAGRAAVDPQPGFLLSAQPCRPTSRGEVALSSPDPRAAPTIRPNSLSTDHDQAMAVEAGRALQRLAQTPAIRAVTRARPSPDPIAMDDAALLEDFRARASTVFHPSCTCRMGRDATTSALDPRLRVHGARGLRVVDASAFPSVTSGNTNAPVMMLAARAAELILEDAAQGPP